MRNWREISDYLQERRQIRRKLDEKSREFW